MSSDPVPTPVVKAALDDLATADESVPDADPDEGVPGADSDEGPEPAAAVHSHDDVGAVVDDLEEAADFAAAGGVERLRASVSDPASPAGRVLAAFERYQRAAAGPAAESDAIDGRRTAGRSSPRRWLHFHSGRGTDLRPGRQGADT